MKESLNTTRKTTVKKTNVRKVPVKKTSEFEIPINSVNIKKTPVKKKPSPIHETPQNKTGAWITIIVIAIIGIIVINSMLEENRSDDRPSVKSDSWKDPGLYESGSDDWPYYGKTNTQLINDLNNQFYNQPQNSENEQKLYNMVGGMYLDKNATTSTIRRYDLLEVPISVSYIYTNSTWIYGKFLSGGVKENDPRLPK